MRTDSARLGPARRVAAPSAHRRAARGARTRSTASARRPRSARSSSTSTARRRSTRSSSGTRSRSPARAAWSGSAACSGSSRFVPPVGSHPFDPTEMARDAIRLERYYQRSGFPRADVEYQAQYRAKSDAVQVTYRIDEGPPLTVDTLQFTGMNGPLDLPESLGRSWRRFTRTEQDHVGRAGEDEKRALADSTVRWFRAHGYPFAIGPYAGSGGQRRQPRRPRGAGGSGPAGAGPTHRRDRQRDDSRSARSSASSRSRRATGTTPRRSRRRGSSSPRWTSCGWRRWTCRAIRRRTRPWWWCSAWPRARSTSSRARPDSSPRAGSPPRPPGPTGAGSAASGPSPSRPRRRPGLAALENPAQQLYRLNLTAFQPYVGDRRISAAGGPFVEYRSDLRDRSWGVGFEGSLVWAPAPLQSISLGYSISHRRVYDYGIGSDLTPEEYLPLLGLADPGAVGELEKSRNRSALTLEGSYGRLDRIANPRKGYVIRPRIETTLPGFNTSEYVLLDLGATAYLPLTKTVGFTLRGGAGRIYPRGNSLATVGEESPFVSLLRLRDVTFTAGGTRDVRGWGALLVGPQDPAGPSGGQRRQYGGGGRPLHAGRRARAADRQRRAPLPDADAERGVSALSCSTTAAGSGRPTSASP